MIERSRNHPSTTAKEHTCDTEPPQWLANGENAIQHLAFGMKSGFVTQLRLIGSSLQCEIENPLSEKLHRFTHYDISAVAFASLVKRLLPEIENMNPNRETEGERDLKFQNSAGESDLLSYKWKVKFSGRLPILTVSPKLNASPSKPDQWLEELVVPPLIRPHADSHLSTLREQIEEVLYSSGKFDSIALEISIDFSSSSSIRIGNLTSRSMAIEVKKDIERALSGTKIEITSYQRSRQEDSNLLEKDLDPFKSRQRWAVRVRAQLNGAQ